MLENLESKYKGFIIVLFLMLIGHLSLVVTGNTVHTIIYSAFSLIILWIAKPLWLPSGHGKNKIRLYSLFIASITVISSLSPSINLKITNSLKNEFSSNLPQSLIDFTYGNIPTPVLIFTALIIFIVNYFISENKIMGKSADSFDEIIPEPDFKERLHFALEALNEDIKSINKQTDWTGSFFTNLDAEVYIRTRKGNKKKASDLLKAMKAKSGRAFLILGHPGAGKSVALRKLAQDLLMQAKSANKIPIYINLKEWNNTTWSESSPPTEDELYAFVRENVARRDRALSIFVDKYFDRLYEKRKLFFIFDSFDEIPQVMNTHNDSLLIDKLSDVLFKFIKDNNGQPTGILASRHFRKPTKSFDASREIEIRPFNETQVTTTLRKMGNDSKPFINQIFTSRSDLYFTAKNPFMASMLAKYIDSHKSLPRSQLEMFSSFIDDSLNTSNRKLKELSISKDQIVMASKKIAMRMFSDYGLEAPISKLKEDIKDHDIDAVLECLKFSRIVRTSSIDDGRISFVHRRFCEYFVVVDLLENDQDLHFSHIPKDSQWRDALVLYCEVASKEKIDVIARNCWSVIKDDNSKGGIEAIHCIRFLRDAFKARLECIKEIQGEIEEFIGAELEKDNPPYWTKLIIELLCLTSEPTKDKCVIKSLKIRDIWISQTALEACRSLPSMSNELEWRVGKYLSSLSDFKFFSNLSSYYFAFGISEAFKRIKLYIVSRTITSLLLSLILLTLIATNPTLGFLILLMIFAQSCFLYLSTLLKIQLNLERKTSSNIKENTCKSGGNDSKELTIKSPRDFFEGLHQVIHISKIVLLISPFIFLYPSIIELIPENLSPDILFKKGDNDEGEFITLNSFGIVPIYVTAYLLTLISMMDLNIIVKRTINLKSFAKSSIILILMPMAVLPIAILLLNISILIKIIASFYLLVIAYFSYKIWPNLKAYFIALKNYKKISKRSITTREELYDYIHSLNGHSRFITKLLIKVDSETTQMYGEWPSKELLKQSAGQYTSLLSQLDMRWRGID
ncbi:hypothetical protein A1OS_18050 [Enterovibrio norvegicus]|uniref:NACHT domain-containing protein n=1 Tax=Enterovibrio norvegicus TaxID=188144 RepID=UPI0003149C13|nr:NACHT domain-containing protein [Enterovibrio norvegicus]OEE62522.1 hypothetical protein A1OS_18050 [Enterovibrio norvegicus]